MRLPPVRKFMPDTGQRRLPGANMLPPSRISRADVPQNPVPSRQSRKTGKILLIQVRRPGLHGQRKKTVGSIFQNQTANRHRIAGGVGFVLNRKPSSLRKRMLPLCEGTPPRIRKRTSPSHRSVESCQTAKSARGGVPPRASLFRIICMSPSRKGAVCPRRNDDFDALRT